jgi:adenosylcobinamide amidohydrolase
MEDACWAEEGFEDQWVLAFVTAGVKSNALRIGVDSARNIEQGNKFRSLGTINSIVISSAELTRPAMAASFITITEAKTIALEKFDVRSSYNPNIKATGTGTDQIVVISGTGQRCSYVGGHSKLGELMGRAVSRATSEAISKRYYLES